MNDPMPIAVSPTGIRSLGHRSPERRSLWETAVALVLLVLATTPAIAQAPTGGSTIHRAQDPLVLTGGVLSLVNNASIADVRLYAFDGANWVALPFQVDEVSGGLYVAPGTDADDGGTAQLDFDDELVFMGFDAGTTASCENSINLVGGPHLRERVTITDPLTGDEGTAYLFVQPALPISPASYISWSALDQKINGAYNGSYEIEFGSVEQPQFLGIANLSPNGGPDILDRMKTFVDLDMRIDIGFGCAPGLPFNVTANEEVLVGTYNVDPMVDFTSVGAVRAVQQGGLFALYGSRFDISGVLDPSSFDDPLVCPGSIEVALLRISLDLNDPSGHGVDTYFDSNSTTATIDGAPDSVPSTPVPLWYQVNGGGAGLGGLVQVISGLDVGTGTANGFYLDDSAAGGTGDGSSYGEFGQDLLGNGVTVATSAYILPPGTTTPVGAAYLSGVINPLEGTTVVEDCSVAEPPEIFADGFEGGNTSAWSSTTGG